MRKIFLFFIILIIFLVKNSFSQENTMYMMYDIHHANQLNPAIQDNYSLFFGIPGISAVRTNFEMTGFNVVDLAENTDNLSPILDRVNYFDFNFSLNWISLGFRINNNQLNFDINERYSSRIGIPKDLILFGWQGNADFVGEILDFSKMDFDFSYFREYALGYSWSINKNLTLGTKAKFLSGIFDINTSKWNMNIYTNPDGFDLELNSDVEINASLPLLLEYETGDTSAVYSINDIERNANQYLNHYVFNNYNPGFAFDFGAIYEPVSKLKIMASVTDIGYIKWKSDVFTIYQNGNYTFTGTDLFDEVDSLGSIAVEEDKDNILDTIVSVFKIRGSGKSYKKWINPNVYIGANWLLDKNINVGLLYHSVIYDYKPLNTFTLSLNTLMKNFLSTSVCYTYSPNLGSNIGFGLGIRAGWFQMYFVLDNLAGYRWDSKDKFIWPAYTQNADFRFGLNLLIGRLDKDSNRKQRGSLPD